MTKPTECSGRVLDMRLRGRGFEPHRCHCLVSLSKTHKSKLSTGTTQEDPSLHNWKIVDGMERIKSNKKHDKTNKMSVQSKGILGCAFWVTMDSSFLDRDSKDYDPNELMPRLIWVFWWPTSTLHRWKFTGLFLNSGFWGWLSASKCWIRKITIGSLIYIGSV